MKAVDVVYIRPLGDFRHFEARLLEVVRRVGAGVRFTKALPSQLLKFTREHVFLSKTVPNVVVLRCGEVVAQTIGDLPRCELDLLVRRAVACAV